MANQQSRIRSDCGSLEIAKGPVVFGGLLANPAEGRKGMFIVFADDIELEGLQSAFNSRWP